VTPSTKLLHFIASPDMENCELTAYKDSGGIWTIGVGHTGGVYEGQTLSYNQAMLWLAADLATASNAVNKAVRVPILQNEFDAFCSLGFNIGAHAMANSSAVAAFNAGDKELAAEKILLWDKVAGKVANGLLKRRSCEAMMLLGEPWQVSRFAVESVPAINTATLTRCMAAYA
jgi:lysozyme